MLIALGFLLALVVMSDAVRTVINLTEKRGPIARSVLVSGRWAARHLPARARSSAGLVITLAVILSWTLGLWTAWTVALLDPSIEIVRNGEDEPLGFGDTIYVAGFSIFTLGTGDLEVVGSLGRLVTTVAAGTGLFTITLEVTYLLQLTSAAAHERSAARQAYALGGDVATIVRRSWDGESFRQVEPLLLQLSLTLNVLAEHHRTFPVLHDVLPRERSQALGPTLLALSDSLDVMHHAAATAQGISRLVYEQLTDALDALLGGLPPGGPDPPPPPSAPQVGALFDAVGCDAHRPAVPDEQAIRSRRHGLFALAVEEGWPEAAGEAVRVAD